MIDVTNFVLGISSICYLREVALSQHGQILKGAVQSATLVLTQDLNCVSLGAQPEAVFSQLRCVLQVSVGVGVGVNRADYHTRGWILASMGHL